MATDYTLQRLRRMIELMIPEAEVVATCRILWDGWESDNRAVLVRHFGEIRCATTDHGRLVWVDQSYLRERLKEYERCTQETTALLAAWDRVEGAIAGSRDQADRRARPVEAEGSVRAAGDVPGGAS